MKSVADVIGDTMLLIISLAIVAVLFSQRSKTTEVIQAAGAAFGTILGVVVKPLSQA